MTEVARRSEVWWAALPPARRSGPGFERPVLVVSADAYNRSRIATVVCVAITSNLDLADAPGNVLLQAGDGGLDRHSVVNCSQVFTLDKTYLRDRLGALTGSQMDLVALGLRRVLAL